MVDLWNILISLTCWSSVAYSSDQQISLEWPQAPFPWHPQKFFQGGQRRHFACIFQVADDAMQIDVHKTHYSFYAKRNCFISRISHKKCTSLAATARHIAISYKIDYLQILQVEYFFTKKQIAMVFNKTTIMSLFYQARFASITWKQELQMCKTGVPKLGYMYP